MSSEYEVNISLALYFLFLKALIKIQKSSTLNNFSATAFHFIASLFD
jgi:hypothetical protein